MDSCRFTTPLHGVVALSADFREDAALQRDRSLYKFIWVRRGRLSLSVDQVPITLESDQIIALTPLHRLLFTEHNDAQFLTFLFNSNFYCIYGHDNEVSCNGFLFNGSAHPMVLTLTPEESAALDSITAELQAEYRTSDPLQEEMLRIGLKRFIITCTRIARNRCDVTPQNEHSFDTIRRFYVLLDEHFRHKKQVQDYADLLCRSPKTLSNIFSAAGLPSPLRIIRERVEAEARRLLLYTSKSAKEIADILGFEDAATFSRFFKAMTGESISEFRHREKLPTSAE